MNQIIYEEIRERNKEIIYTDRLLDLFYKEIMNLQMVSTICRKEGLLAIEDYIANNEMFDEGSPCNDLLMQVVDGTDPKVIEEIALIKYFTCGYSAEKAVLFLMDIVGVCAIQNGQNSREIESLLEAFIPVCIQKEYFQRKSIKEEQERKSEEEQIKEEIEILSKYVNTYKNKSGADIGSFLFDRVFESADNYDISQILKEVDNNDLAIALKQTNGLSIKKIFECLGYEKTKEIIKDMQFIGSVRVEDINKAKANILDKIVRMLNQGKINPDGFAMLLGVINGMF